MNVLTLVLLTAIFRSAEIVYGDLNARAMLKKGGKEFNPLQRVPVFLLYAVWLAALLYVVPWDQQPDPLFLVLFWAAQGLRWWAIWHLKSFWTTRIVILPLAWKIKSGPYAFMSHPIYIALISEIMALSLMFDQLAAACIAGGLTMAWLFFRIRAENRALTMML